MPVWPPSQEEAELDPRWVFYTGRLVWKRQIEQMRHAAEDLGLRFTHEARHRVLTTKLTVAVDGDPRAIAEFSKAVMSIAMMYGEPPAS